MTGNPESGTSRCNYCGARNRSALFDNVYPSIMRCDSCGLIFNAEMPSEEELASIYTEKYYKSKDSLTYGYTNYMDDRANIVKTARKRLRDIERLKAGGSLLDVGCAFGFFLSIARKRGWDGYGVDLSAVPCRYAREELGLQVIHGALRQAHFADEYFDAAIMNDVFEHFSDPLAELAEVYRVRKTGGYSFIVTQDISSLMVRLLGCRCAQYKPREHLYYFTRDTLRSILEKSSFSVIRGDSESLVCSVNFLVGKLQNLNGSLGMLAGFLARRLRLQDALIPVRPGY